MDLKEIIKNPNPCTFQNFRKGNMWYKTACGFEFPISVDPDEIGDAIFNAEEKPMLLMRYIRKHIEALKSEREAIDEKLRTEGSE